MTTTTHQAHRQAQAGELCRISLVIIPVGPDGRRGKRRRVRTHSWLKNMAAFICFAFYGNTGAIANDITNTGGTTRTLVTGGNSFRADAAVGDDTYGILAGTSTTAPTRDDFALGTKIATGIGSGQLSYLANNILKTTNTVTPITGGYRVSLTRQFDNDSGGSITITEVGLAVEATPTAGGAQAFLVLHDLLPGSGVAVADGSGIILRYQLDWLA